MLYLMKILGYLLKYKEIVGLVVAFLSLWGYITYQVNTKFNDKIDEFTIQQNEKLSKISEEVRDVQKSFSTETDTLFKKLEQDRIQTGDLNEEHRTTDGATDSSGINGKFLRD